MLSSEVLVQTPESDSKQSQIVMVGVGANPAKNFKLQHIDSNINIVINRNKKKIEDLWFTSLESYFLLIKMYMGWRTTG